MPSDHENVSIAGGEADDEQSERLLPSASSDVNQGDEPSSNNYSKLCSYLTLSSATRQQLKSGWDTWKIPILCYIFALLADCGDTLRSTPKTRLLESILCNRYYEKHPPTNGTFVGQSGFQTKWPQIPEEQCKVAPVQGELVTMKAWLKVGENLLGELYIQLPIQCST